MKFSWDYVKSRPVMFGTIFVVFGLLVWFMLNKDSGGAAGTTSYISSGPTDAQVAGQVALGQASIAANASNTQAQLQLAAINAQSQAQIAALTIQGQNDLALGSLQSQVALAEMSASREIALQQTDAALTATLAGYSANLASQANNNATQVAIYKGANDAAIEQSRVNAALQTTLSAQQADAFKTASILSIIPTLKKKDRDNALVSIATGAPYRGNNIGHQTLLTSVTAA